jgi:Asp-tRNA(Asn)/Glu-tRNA(Gln) amidotransferase A subunit family amidase
MAGTQLAQAVRISPAVPKRWSRHCLPCQPCPGDSNDVQLVVWQGAACIGRGATKAAAARTGAARRRTVTPLNQWGAVDLAQSLARRELRAQDVVRACLDHIAEREPTVQAFTHLAADAALAAARQLDEGPLRGPLHGLPLGVKDLFDTHDMPSGYGSSIYAGHRPSSDAAVVATCRGAGAVVIGKTVSTEFATFQPGPTRNPHDLHCTPGGSSSGSAAAVADSMLPLALGSQTAGSIIRPAAYCGVVGFKPSYGLVPRAGMKLLSESLDTVGGFARSVADVAWLVSVLTGDDSLCLTDTPPPAHAVGWFEGPHWLAVGSSTQALWQRVINKVATLMPGSSALPVPAWFESLHTLQADVMLHEAAQSLSYERLHHGTQLSARLTAMLQEGLTITGATHADNLVSLHVLRLRAASLFERHRLLIAPSAAGEAGPAGEGTGDPLFCRAWTLLGLPCLHLPLGLGDRGLPIGLQLIGRYGDDARVLQVGAWLHHALHD